MSLRKTLPLLIGRATDKLPPSFDKNFWRGLRLFKKIPLWKVSGTTHAGIPGTLLLAGADPLEIYLLKRFLVGEPTEVRALGTYSFLKLGSAVRTQRACAELTVLQLDRIIARRLLRPEYHCVPMWVRSKFPVPERIESLATGHNSLRQDLRLLRKYGYSYSETKDKADLETFFKLIYLPHGLGRYGPKAHLRSFRAVEESFRRGALLWIMEKDERVGGIVVERKGPTMIFAAIGALNGNEALLKKGILSAGYYFGIQYAARLGCTEIDLGGTRPCLTDGLAIYKKKWGARLSPEPIGTQECLTYWPKVTPSIWAMLNQTPLVTLKNGEVIVLHGDGAEALSERALQGVNHVVRVSQAAAHA